MLLSGSEKRAGQGRREVGGGRGRVAQAGPYGDLGDVASDVEMPGRVERRPLTRSDAAEPVPNRPHHGRRGPHGTCVGQAPRRMSESATR